MTTIERRRLLYLGAGLLLAGLVAVAWARMGALGLPSVPSSVTLESAGLVGLDEMRLLDRRVCGDPGEGLGTLSEAATLVSEGIHLIRDGDETQGLERMREGVRLEPDNLVLANAYRMEVFRLQREFLSRASQTASLAPTFPGHLEGQPIAFLENLVTVHPVREAKLSLALAWVDKMLLFPALEIKAPSSVSSVDILTEIIEEHPHYVPALFARGLNHLHRPARLVWPETRAVPPDSAVRDIGLCIAIGRKVDAGSDRLKGTLAIAIGDAYVKAAEYGRARSWWQIAQNLCGDDDIHSQIRRRYGWKDEEILDRLEEELDRARSEIVDPMTNLAFMWN